MTFDAPGASATFDALGASEKPDALGASATPESRSVTEALADRARRFGPIRFDELMDAALYAPGAGFYESGHGAGGHGADFLTSPELGPLFGAVLANALDSWWTELGLPDPFVVIEAGAGRGTLAASILAAAPQCAAALHYLLVERSAAGREAQSTRLALEPPAQVLGSVIVGDEDEPPMPLRRTGPIVASLQDLPAGRFTGVVLANELLDNLAVRLLERGEDDGWSEVHCDHRGQEVLVVAAASVVAQAQGLAPEAVARARIALQGQAQQWLRRALGCLAEGRVVVIDYVSSTPSMASRPWTDWLRTYRGHGRGGHPLALLGAQDITCEVAVDQLAAVVPLSANQSQAEFLAAHGLDELVSAARRTWTERVPIGDLEALKARSRISEGAALVDPTGLGAFRVMQWRR